MILRVALRRQLEPVALREPLDVPSVEELHTDVRVQPLDLAQLSVLPGDEGLLHDGDLDEEVLLGEVEVGRERADHAAVRVALENEGVRLVVPRDAVVVEDLCALNLDTVREPRGCVATICLENGVFHPHLRQGTYGLGRPPDAP